MNCEKALPDVSALCDGEQIGTEAAVHISGCPACRARLREYTEIGAELRLAAGCAAQRELTPAIRALMAARRRRWLSTWMRRVPVPRFAIAATLLAVVSLVAGLGWLQAQSSGLWFHYELTWDGVHAHANAHGDLLPGAVNGEDRGVTELGEDNIHVLFQIKVEEIREGRVHLLVGAKKTIGPSDRRVSKEALAQMKLQELWYVPGDRVELPIEGGGTFPFWGSIVAGSRLRPTPAELGPGQIAMGSPAIVGGNEFLGEVSGESGSVGAENATVAIYIPKNGLWIVALEEFAGAVRGEAAWGNVRFTIDGKEYRIYSWIPVTGGPQPRAVWIYYDARYVPGPQMDSPADKPWMRLGAFETLTQRLGIQP